MSLFVAVRPSEEAMAHLDEALERVRRDPVAGTLRWQPATRWHITVAFLGETGEDRESAVCDALDAVGRVSAPVSDLRLEGTGIFGRRIVWIPVLGEGSVPSAEFSALADHVTAALRRQHIAIERRRWQPHLTIGRARQGDPSPVAALLSAYAGPTWSVRELMLVRSTGGPSPTHRVCHTSHLSGHPGAPTGP